MEGVSLLMSGTIQKRKKKMIFWAQETFTLKQVEHFMMLMMFLIHTGNTEYVILKDYFLLLQPSSVIQQLWEQQF